MLTTKSNVIVLADETHRSQYKGMAKNMRDALPNAVFISFTGTPIDKEDKSTSRTFGSYIDKYGIQQAVQDRIIKRFLQPIEEDKPCFLIVKDMLLTGFDAPIEQVMYLGRPLKEHNLLQAIARMNRTYGVRMDL